MTVSLMTMATCSVGVSIWDTRPTVCQQVREAPTVQLLVLALGETGAEVPRSLLISVHF